MIRESLSTVSDAYDILRTFGLSGGLRHIAGTTYLRGSRSIVGQNVFEKEWDVLVILDACRFDELQRVADHYEFLQGGIGTHPTVASCTWEWIPRTFVPEHASTLAETSYVCANPFSKDIDVELRDLDEVWRYAWDSELRTVPPRPVTDRAITLAREQDPERLIVHYLQPHAPFLNMPDLEPDELSNFDIEGQEGLGSWGYVRRGDIPLEVAKEGYRYNLRRVLDDVSLLLDNLDAERVVISADHGEAFGEYGIYGHPPRTPLDALTQVPWCVTSATDERTHEPATYDFTPNEESVTDRLSALGYVEP